MYDWYRSWNEGYAGQSLSGRHELAIYVLFFIKFLLTAAIE